MFHILLILLQDWEIYSAFFFLLLSELSGAFNRFPDIFVQAFKTIVDSRQFSILLLYILWDNWPIFMISGSNEQLQQELEW